MNKCTLIVLLVASVVRGHSQDMSIKPHWSAVGLLGLSFSGNTSWVFYGDNTFVQTHPKIAVGLGIQYGPIASILGSSVAVSLEAMYGEAQTDDHSLKGIPVEMGIKRLPIMFYGSFETESELTPFLRIGVGVSRTDFRELYSTLPGPTAQFSTWGFCRSLGGGIKYHASERVDVALFLESWVTGKVLETVPGFGERGIGSTNGMIPIGFRTTIRL